MGSTIHKALIITTWCDGSFSFIHKAARKINLQFEMMSSPCNAVKTIFIYPTGSKAGWEDDVNHVQKIDDLISVIESLKNEDDGNRVDYVYLQCGDNGLDTKTNCIDKINGTGLPSLKTSNGLMYGDWIKHVGSFKSLLGLNGEPWCGIVISVSPFVIASGDGKTRYTHREPIEFQCTLKAVKSEILMAEGLHLGLPPVNPNGCDYD